MGTPTSVALGSMLLEGELACRGWRKEGVRREDVPIIRQHLPRYRAQYTFLEGRKQGAPEDTSRSSGMIR